MTLRQRLHDWQLPLPTPPQVPEKPRLFIKSWETIRPKLEGIQPMQPKASDLDTIFQAIRNHFQAVGTLEGLSNSLLKHAPWVIFTHPSKPGELGANSRFVNLYLTWLGKILSSRAAANLLFAFLYDYPARLETFHLWRNGLFHVLSSTPNQRLTQNRVRCQQFHLLNKDGPYRLARILAESDASPATTLVDAGLIGQLENSEFAKAVFRKLLNILSEALRTRRPQQSLLDKVMDISAGSENRGLRFPTEAAHLADAMLLPYAENQAWEGHQEAIRTFLAQSMGDPRINESGWIGADEKAKDVMFRWLVKTSLEDFFNILSKTAQEMWQARRNFWSSYLRGNYISHAWVVLGRQARYIAKEHFGSKNIYGNLIGAGSSQSVLLMRIGGLTIAEWSHAGSCRIWALEGPSTPVFYKLNYKAIELRGSSDLQEPHVIEHRGQKWPMKIRKFIQYHTGVT